MTRNAILGLGLLALIVLAVLCIWTHAGNILSAQGGMPPLVDLTADAGTIIARGVLPDDTTRMRFVNRAREVFGADLVIDRMRVADTVGVPHWMDDVLDVMPLLGHGVNKAGMRVVGDTLTLKGEVASGEAKADILQKAVSIVNDGLVVKDRLVVVTRAAKLARVQVNLDEELKGKTIEFASSSARITPRGTAVLDRLIPIIHSVEDATIEISGHTDPTGGEALNRELSQARARSVLEYCVAKGVPRERLKAVGYGSKKPVASNATPWGRLANRRIEFHVL
ncbi:MAG TPA: OmpA family protein [Bacteroidota bacterium]|nr:OmpA family protein [Bacteroidota bacterium]